MVSSRSLNDLLRLLTLFANEMTKGMTVVFAIEKTSFLDFAQQNINIFLTNPDHTLCLLTNI